MAGEDAVVRGDASPLIASLKQAETALREFESFASRYDAQQGQGSSQATTQYQQLLDVIRGLSTAFEQAARARRAFTETPTAGAAPATAPPRPAQTQGFDDARQAIRQLSQLADGLAQKLGPQLGAQLRENVAEMGRLAERAAAAITRPVTNTGPRVATQDDIRATRDQANATTARGAAATQAGAQETSANQASAKQLQRLNALEVEHQRLLEQRARAANATVPRGKVFEGGELRPGARRAVEDLGRNPEEFTRAFRGDNGSFNQGAARTALGDIQQSRVSAVDEEIAANRRLEAEYQRRITTTNQTAAAEQQVAQAHRRSYQVYNDQFQRVTKNVGFNTEARRFERVEAVQGGRSIRTPIIDEQEIANLRESFARAAQRVPVTRLESLRQRAEGAGTNQAGANNGVFNVFGKPDLVYDENLKRAVNLRTGVMLSEKASGEAVQAAETRYAAMVEQAAKEYRTASLIQRARSGDGARFLNPTTVFDERTNTAQRTSGTVLSAEQRDAALARERQSAETRNIAARERQTEAMLRQTRGLEQVGQVARVRSAVPGLPDQIFRRSGDRATELNSLDPAYQRAAAALDAAAAADRARALASELLADKQRGIARQIGPNVLERGGRYYGFSNGGTQARELGGLGGQNARTQDPAQRGLLQNFLAGFTSRGFGGAAGGRIDLGGLAQSAGTTVKYTALYSALNQVQAAAASAAEQLLNYEDSIAGIELAYEDGQRPSDAFINSLTDIAAVAGTNVGDVMDTAAVAMRSFGSETDGSTAAVNRIGVAFANTAAQLSLITGQSFDQSANNIRAIIGSISDPGSAPTQADFTAIQDAISGAYGDFGGDANDVADGFRAIASSAKEAGFSVNETANIASVVTGRLGESGELAGTRLSRVFAIIGGTEGQNAIRKLNQALTPEQRIDITGTVAEQVRQLSNIYGELSDKQRQALGSSLGGTANTRELFALLSNGSKALQQNGQDFDYAGRGAEEFAKRIQNLRGLLTQLQGNVTGIVTGLSRAGIVGPLGVALELVNGIAKTVRDAIQFVNDLTTGFGTIPEEVRQIAVGLLAVYATLRLISAIRNRGGLSALATVGGRVEGVVAPQNAVARNQLRQQRQDATQQRGAQQRGLRPGAIPFAPGTVPFTREIAREARADRVSAGTAERQAGRTFNDARRQFGSNDFRTRVAAQRLDDARTAAAAATVRSNAAERDLGAATRQQAQQRRTAGLRADRVLFTPQGFANGTRGAITGLQDRYAQLRGAGASRFGAGLGALPGAAAVSNAVAANRGYGPTLREQLRTARAENPARVATPPQLNQLRNLGAQFGGAVQSANDRLQGAIRSTTALTTSSLGQLVRSQQLARAQQRVTQLRQVPLAGESVAQQAARRAALAAAQQNVDRIRATPSPAALSPLGQRLSNVSNTATRALTGLSERSPAALSNALGRLQQQFNNSTGAVGNLRRGLGAFNAGMLRTTSALSGVVSSALGSRFALQIRAVGTALAGEIGLLGGILIGIAAFTAVKAGVERNLQAQDETRTVIDAGPQDNSVQGLKDYADSLRQQGNAAKEASSGLIGNLTDITNSTADGATEALNKAAAVSAEAERRVRAQKKAAEQSASTVSLDFSSADNLSSSLEALQTGGRDAATQMLAFNNALAAFVDNAVSGGRKLTQPELRELGLKSEDAATNALGTQRDILENQSGAVADTVSKLFGQDFTAAQGNSQRIQSQKEEIDPELRSAASAAVKQVAGEGISLASKQGEDRVREILTANYRAILAKYGITDEATVRSIALDVAATTSAAARDAVGTGTDGLSLAEIVAQAQPVAQAAGQQRQIETSLTGGLQGGALAGATETRDQLRAALAQGRRVAAATIAKAAPEDRAAVTTEQNSQLDALILQVKQADIAVNDATASHLASQGALAASLIPSTNTLAALNSQATTLLFQLAFTKDADQRNALQAQINQLNQQIAQETLKQAQAQRRANISPYDTAGIAQDAVVAAQETLDQIRKSGDTSSAAEAAARQQLAENQRAAREANLAKTASIARSTIDSRDDVGNARQDLTDIQRAVASLPEGTATQQERADLLRELNEKQNAFDDAMRESNQAVARLTIDSRDSIGNLSQDIKDLYDNLGALPNTPDFAGQRAKIQNDINAKNNDLNTANREADQQVTRAGIDPRNAAGNLGQDISDLQGALAALPDTEGFRGQRAQLVRQIAEKQQAFVSQLIEDSDTLARLAIDSRDTLGTLRQDVAKLQAQLDAIPNTPALAAVRAGIQKQIIDAQRQAANEALAITNAQNLASLAPGDSVGEANEALRYARDQLQAALPGTKEYANLQREVAQAQVNLATAQADAAANTRRLTIDLTNSVQSALADYQAALDQVNALRNSGASQDAINAAQVDANQKKAQYQQTQFNAELYTIQTAEQLDRITHAEAMQRYKTLRGQLAAQLATMKTTETGYDQIQKEIDQIDLILKQASESVNQAFNLQDATLPTIYEVRRAVGASASQIRTQVADYSNSGNTVVLNGVDLNTVIAYINKTLGTGSKAVFTTSPRRV